MIVGARSDRQAGYEPLPCMRLHEPRERIDWARVARHFSRAERW